MKYQYHLNDRRTDWPFGNELSKSKYPNYDFVVKIAKDVSTIKERIDKYGQFCKLVKSQKHLNKYNKQQFDQYQIKRQKQQTSLLHKMQSRNTQNIQSARSISRKREVGKFTSKKSLGEQLSNKSGTFQYSRELGSDSSIKINIYKPQQHDQLESELQNLVRRFSELTTAHKKWKDTATLKTINQQLIAISKRITQVTTKRSHHFENYE